MDIDLTTDPHLDWNNKYTAVLQWAEDIVYEDGFEIYRDGAHLADLLADEFNYEDPNLACNTTYTYEVRPWALVCSPLNCSSYIVPVTTGQCFGTLEGHVWIEGINSGAVSGLPIVADGDECTTNLAQIRFPRAGSVEEVSVDLADYIGAPDDAIGEILCDKYTIHNIRPDPVTDIATIQVTAPAGYQVAFIRKIEAGGVETTENIETGRVGTYPVDIEFGSPETLDAGVQENVYPWFRVVGGDVGAKREFFSKVPVDRGHLIEGEDAALIAETISEAGGDTISENQDWRVDGYNYLTTAGDIYDKLEESLLDKKEELDLQESDPLPDPLKDSYAHVYFRAGDYTPSATVYETEENIIIVVQGDLTLESNVVGPDDSQSGLVFVVRGDVNIEYSVSEVDALLYFAGQFTDIYPDYSGFSWQLYINGGLIGSAGNAFDDGGLGRDLGPVGNNNFPAEVITYDPKYLTKFIPELGESLYIQKEDWVLK